MATPRALVGQLLSSGEVSAIGKSKNAPWCRCDAWRCNICRRTYKRTLAWTYDSIINKAIQRHFDAVHFKVSKLKHKQVERERARGRWRRRRRPRRR